MYSNFSVSAESVEFDWDLGNENKNYLKHNVTKLEAEEVFFDFSLVDDDEKHSGDEFRRRLIGKTDDGRILTVVFVVRAGKLRVISARPADRRERSNYEKAQGNTKI